jgi:formylglycine-generating enzyme required for sulfatase activity
MAARGGPGGRRYPWDDALPDELLNRPETGRRKMLVGQTPPNGFGLLDVTGNVSQWCQDFYDRHYYSKSPVINPKGPQRGELRVVRGGSFLAGPRLLRCAARFAADPKTTSRTIGFRCVRSRDGRFQ